MLHHWDGTLCLRVINLCKWESSCTLATSSRCLQTKLLGYLVPGSECTFFEIFQCTIWFGWNANTAARGHRQMCTSSMCASVEECESRKQYETGKMSGWRVEHCKGVCPTPLCFSLAQRNSNVHAAPVSCCKFCCCSHSIRTRYYSHCLVPTSRVACMCCKICSSFEEVFRSVQFSHMLWLLVPVSELVWHTNMFRGGFTTIERLHDW